MGLEGLGRRIVDGVNNLFVDKSQSSVTDSLAKAQMSEGGKSREAVSENSSKVMKGNKEYTISTDEKGGRLVEIGEKKYRVTASQLKGVPEDNKNNTALALVRSKLISREKTEGSGPIQSPSSTSKAFPGGGVLNRTITTFSSLKNELVEAFSSKKGESNSTASRVGAKGKLTSEAKAVSKDEVLENIVSNGNPEGFGSLPQLQQKEVMKILLEDFIKPAGQQNSNIVAVLLNPSNEVGKAFESLCEEKYIKEEYAFCRDWTVFKDMPPSPEKELLLNKIKDEHRDNRGANLTAGTGGEQGLLKNLTSGDREAIEKADSEFNKSNHVITIFKQSVGGWISKPNFLQAP